MKRRFALLLAAVLLSPSMSARAEPMRVFYAPGERPRITAERAAMLAKTQTLQSDVAIVDAAAASGSAGARTAAAQPRLEGVSLARGGNAHAWIGGARYQDGSLFRGQRLRVRPNGVQLMGAAGVTRLFRVGESIPEGSSPPAASSP